jgi:hypothetical protein
MTDDLLIQCMTNGSLVFGLLSGLLLVLLFAIVWGYHHDA